MERRHLNPINRQNLEPAEWMRRSYFFLTPSEIQKYFPHPAQRCKDYTPNGIPLPDCSKILHELPDSSRHRSARIHRKLAKGPPVPILTPLPNIF